MARLAHESDRDFSVKFAHMFAQSIMTDALNEWSEQHPRARIVDVKVSGEQFLNVVIMYHEEA